MRRSFHIFVDVMCKVFLAFLSSHFVAEPAFIYSLFGEGKLNFYQYGSYSQSSILEEKLTLNFRSPIYKSYIGNASLNLTLQNYTEFQTDTNNFSWGGHLNLSFLEDKTFPILASVFRNDNINVNTSFSSKRLSQGYSLSFFLKPARFPVVRVSWNDTYHKNRTLFDEEESLLSRNRIQTFTINGYLGGAGYQSSFAVAYNRSDDFINRINTSSMGVSFYNYFNPWRQLTIINRFYVSRLKSQDTDFYLANRDILFSNTLTYDFSSSKRLHSTFSIRRSKTDGVENRSDSVGVDFRWIPRSNFVLSGGGNFSYSRYSDGVTGGAVSYLNNFSVSFSKTIWRIALFLGGGIGLGFYLPEGGDAGFYMTDSAGVTARVNYPYYLSHRVAFTFRNSFNTSSQSQSLTYVRVDYEATSRELWGHVRFYGRSLYQYSYNSLPTGVNETHFARVEGQASFRYNHLVRGNVTTGYMRSGETDSVYVKFSVASKPIRRLSAGASFSNVWSFPKGTSPYSTSYLGIGMGYSIGKINLQLSAQFAFGEIRDTYYVFVSLTRSFSLGGPRRYM